MAEPRRHELVRATLERAKAILTVPGQWTRGFLARNYNNQCSLPSSPNATCFCAMGAVLRAKQSPGLVPVDQIENDSLGILTVGVNAVYRDKAGAGAISTPEFNDHKETSVDDVLLAFDMAIGYCVTGVEFEKRLREADAIYEYLRNQCNGDL